MSREASPSETNEAREYRTIFLAQWHPDDTLLPDQDRSFKQLTSFGVVHPDGKVAARVLCVREVTQEGWRVQVSTSTFYTGENLSFTEGDDDQIFDKGEPINHYTQTRFDDTIPKVRSLLEYTVTTEMEDQTHRDVLEVFATEAATSGIQAFMLTQDQKS